MIAPLIALAARVGVPAGLRRVAAWAGLALLAGGLFLAARGGFALWIERHDRKVIAAYKNEQRVAQAERQAAIEAEAAKARTADAVANRDQQEDYHDAIHDPAGDPADAHVRLNCERLRRAGRTAAELPECAGR